MTLGTGDYLTAGQAIDPRPILIVTGLVQEARIAAGPGMAVICSSSSPTPTTLLLVFRKFRYRASAHSGKNFG